MRSLLLILTLAFFVRLLFGVLLLSPEERLLRGDATRYDRLATGLLQGEGLYDADSDYYSARMPLYPAFLALLYRIFGRSFQAVRMVQAVLGVFLCGMIYLIGSRAFGQKVGKVAGFSAVFYPPFVRFSYYSGSGFLLSEALFLPLLALGVYFLVDLFLNPTRRASILSGMGLGLATLTRPTPFLFPPFLLVWALAAWKDRSIYRKRMGHVLMIWGILLLLLFPWMLRNYRIHHAFVPLTTKGGGLFFTGNNPASRGGLVHYDKNPDYPLEEILRLNEVERDRLEYRKGKEFLMGHPKAIPKLFLRKALVQWSPFIEAGAGEVDYNFGYALAVPFAFIGGFEVMRRRRQGGVPLLLVIGYTTVMAMITVGDPRYQHPVEPYLVVLAAFGFVKLFEMKQRIWGLGLSGLVVLPNLFCLLYPEPALRIVKSFLGGGHG